MYKFGFVAYIILGSWHQSLADFFGHKKLIMQSQGPGVLHRLFTNHNKCNIPKGQGLMDEIDALPSGSDSRLDSEEAEYAWLSIDSLKPFREGDSLAFEEDKHISDPTLKACIEAAERAVKTAADRATAAADAELEGEDVDDDSQSDSDGGRLPAPVVCRVVRLKLSQTVVRLFS